jgi:surfactin synthase thioesterase subunit
MLLDEPADLRREIEEISALSNHEIIARLLDDSAYIELDLLKSERSEVVGRAFKHDVCSTYRYLIEVQEEPAHRRLRAPIEVVVGAADPTTAGAGQRYRRWGRVGDTITVHTLEEGGHYFVRNRPADVAALIAAACLAEPAG